MDRIEQTVRVNDMEVFEKNKAKYRFFYVLAAILSAVAIYFLVTTFMILSNPEMNITFLEIVPLIISAAGAIYCFMHKDSMLLEYDYSIEDDKLNIARIINLKSRKEIISLPAGSFKRIVPYGQIRINELDMKVLDCSLNAPECKYVLFYERGNRGAIVFEPNEQLLKMIQKEIGR